MAETDLVKAVEGFTAELAPIREQLRTVSDRFDKPYLMLDRKLDALAVAITDLVYLTPQDAATEIERDVERFKARKRAELKK